MIITSDSDIEEAPSTSADTNPTETSGNLFFNACPNNNKWGQNLTPYCYAIPLTCRHGFSHC